MVSIISLIIVLGVIVFVHELGHFIAAKLTGVRVEQFSLGFPPKMISKKVGETEYMLSWIPLGGYVKMAGMIDESLSKTPLTGAGWEFMSKNFFQKTFILCAGVLMNLILAFLIYAILTFSTGIGEIGPAIIGGIEAGMPADSIGLKTGDLITHINGDTVCGWEDLSGKIHSRPEQVIEVRWLRGDRAMSAEVRTKADEILLNKKKVKAGFIGITAKIQRRPATVLESVSNGAQATYFACSATVIGLYMLIQGEAGIKDFVGPLGIAHYSGEAMISGMAVFLSFLAFISANIALLNILPVPVLDGGHIIFTIIEAFIRRPISSKVKLIIQQVGMALLLVLALVISYNDLMRFFVK